MIKQNRIIRKSYNQIHSEYLYHFNNSHKYTEDIFSSNLSHEIKKLKKKIDQITKQIEIVINIEILIAYQQLTYIDQQYLYF